MKPLGCQGRKFLFKKFLVMPTKDLFSLEIFFFYKTI